MVLIMLVRNIDRGYRHAAAEESQIRGQITDDFAREALRRAEETWTVAATGEWRDNGEPSMTLVVDAGGAAPL
jgi:hypothetical protein